VGCFEDHCTSNAESRLGRPNIKNGVDEYGDVIKVIFFSGKG